MTRRPVLLLLCLFAAACSVPEPADPPGRTVDFRTEPATAFDPSMPDPGPTSLTLREDQQDVVDRIAADPAAFLASGPPVGVLNEAELVFFASGRLFELTGWYADAVEAGATNLRPRLAWAYERTGLHSEAVRAAEQAIEEEPGNAEAWFVIGYVLGQAETAEDAMLERVSEAFSRAVELDPEFVGPGGITASDLRRQATEIRTALRRRHEPAPARARTGGMGRDPHAGVPGAPPLNTMPAPTPGASVPARPPAAADDDESGDEDGHPTE